MAVVLVPDKRFTARGWFSSFATAPGWFYENLADTTAGQVIAVGQVSETNLAQAVSWAPKARLVALVSEIDLAQGVGRLKTVTVGQVAETDFAQALGRVKTKAVGQVTETDLAQAVAWAPKARLVALVLEQDLAQVVTVISGAAQAEFRKLITVHDQVHITAVKG